MNESKKCSFIKADGMQCRMHPLRGGQFCIVHETNPEIKAKFLAGCAKGGRGGKPLAVIAEVINNSLLLRDAPDVKQLLNDELCLFQRGIRSYKELAAVSVWAKAALDAVRVSLQTATNEPFILPKIDPAELAVITQQALNLPLEDKRKAKKGKKFRRVKCPVNLPPAAKVIKSLPAAVVPEPIKQPQTQKSEIKHEPRNEQKFIRFGETTVDVTEFEELRRDLLK
jgi:hypothetical protein